MSDFVVIKAQAQTREKLGKLSKEAGLKQYIYLDHVLSFFEKTGHDPRDTEVASPAEEIKKFRNTIVSFIRRQEKDLLLPMMDRVEEMLKAQARLLQDSSTATLPPKSESSSDTKSESVRKKGKLLIPTSAKKTTPTSRMSTEQKLSFIKERMTKSSDELGYSLNLSKQEYKQLFS